MQFLRQSVSTRTIPVIVSTLGTVTVAATLIATFIPDGKQASPWTKDKPLVMGALVLTERPALPNQSPNLSSSPSPTPLPSSPGLATGDSSPEVQQNFQQRLPISEARYEELRTQLKQALEQKFEGTVEIKLDPIRVNPNDGSSASTVKDIKQKLKNKEWDIAFLPLPILSATAIANDYRFAARMFPNLPPPSYVLFTRKDSQVEQVDDLKPEIRIAMGEIGNDMLFYFPIYDLFGRSLKADIGNKPPDIVRKVSSGTVDVGVGLGLFFDPKGPLPPERQQFFQEQFRVIAKSRVLPPPGVFLSANQQSYHPVLKESLLKIPQGADQRPLYGESPPIDYSAMQQVIQRSEEILGCIDDQLPPPGVLQQVRFFCNSSASDPLPPPPEGGIVAQMNGYQRKSDHVIFTINVVRPSNQIYQLVLPTSIIDQDPGIPELPQLNEQYIHLRDELVKTATPGTPPQIKITKTGQLQVVKWN